MNPIEIRNLRFGGGVKYTLPYVLFHSLQRHDRIRFPFQFHLLTGDPYQTRHYQGTLTCMEKIIKDTVIPSLPLCIQRALLDDLFEHFLHLFHRRHLFHLRRSLFDQSQ